MQKRLIVLAVAAAFVPVTVPAAAEMQPGHGTGLDGVTPVKSLSYSAVEGHPGHFIIQDAAGNLNGATPDELFALLKHIAPDWNITAVQRIQA